MIGELVQLTHEQIAAPGRPRQAPPTRFDRVVEELDDQHLDDRGAGRVPRGRGDASTRACSTWDAPRGRERACAGRRSVRAVDRVPEHPQVVRAEGRPVGRELRRAATARCSSSSARPASARASSSSTSSGCSRPDAGRDLARRRGDLEEGRARDVPGAQEVRDGLPALDALRLDDVRRERRAPAAQAQGPVA